MVFWEMTQCLRISAMLGTTVDTILRESTCFLLAPCTWQSPVLCLPRHSAAFVVDSGGGMCLMVLLVMTHFALYSLLLFSGPDARHHGRYGPEKTVLRVLLAVACARRVLLVFFTSRCVPPCRCQAHDAPHHGWYEPEGQLRGDILADTPVVHNHSCLWFRLQQN